MAWKVDVVYLDRSFCLGTSGGPAWKLGGQEGVQASAAGAATAVVEGRGLWAAVGRGDVSENTWEASSGRRGVVVQCLLQAHRLRRLPLLPSAPLPVGVPTAAFYTRRTPLSHALISAPRPRPGRNGTMRCVSWDVLGGPVVKTSPSSLGCLGSVPGQGPLLCLRAKDP